MKNRLTNRAESGFVYCTQCCINQDKDCVEQDCFKAILDRLAAYEDSQMTPKEVVEIKKYLNMWIENGGKTKWLKQIFLNLVTK